MNRHYRQYLQYVINTGGTATISGFDEDWEPIGPMLRRDLMPTYMVEERGVLVLTDQGRTEVGLS
jgi:hypothetical protein